MKVVIIGGVAGGASAAARLRRLDEHAQIILIERGAYISYANCGLPYYIGGEIEEQEALTLQTPESFRRRFRVDVRVEQEAVAIDRQRKTVTIRRRGGESYEESYDKLLLSPGAEPLVPPVPGLRELTGEEGVFTLRTIPDTLSIDAFIRDRRPRTAVVLGGGYIGLEMAENLVKAGLSVTVVEQADHVIAPLDFDMACEVERYLESKGVTLLLNSPLTSVSRTDGGLLLRAGEQTLAADLLLVAAGVRPENSLVKAADLPVGRRGGILVDEHMRTEDSSIYAVGDAVEVRNLLTGEAQQLPLAGPANRQGRIAADNIAGIGSVYKGGQGSSILKLFDMTVAVTGLNEFSAAAAGMDYDKVFTFSASHATYYPGASNMTVKTVFEKGTGRILGAQLVGFEGVDKRCDVLAVAVRAGMTATDLTELELCYAPPFSSAKDPVNMAGYVIENVLTGKVKQFHWHDIAGLPRDGSITLLDVRTPGEYARGHIDGFRNLPLDSLRDRLSELDRSKPLYVHCQTGLRSYLACRILSQNGFDCYNFAGSYRLYQNVLSRGGCDHALCGPCGITAGKV